MSEATDADYWFLRDNGIDAKTALRILAIAYSVKEQAGGARAMRELKFRYVCKDILGRIFSFIKTIEEMERAELNINTYGRIQEIISRDEYAGLKSINGEEIYEGDTIIHKYNLQVIPREAAYEKVISKHCCFGYEPVFPELRHPDDLGFHPFYDFEEGEQSMDEPALIVIDDKYKNPELMEVEQ